MTGKVKATTKESSEEESESSSEADSDSDSEEKEEAPKVNGKAAKVNAPNVLLSSC